MMNCVLKMMNVWKAHTLGGYAGLGPSSVEPLPYLMSSLRGPGYLGDDDVFPVKWPHVS